MRCRKTYARAEKKNGREFSQHGPRLQLFAARCVAALSTSGRPPPVMFDHPRCPAFFRHYRREKASRAHAFGRARARSPPSPLPLPPLLSRPTLSLVSFLFFFLSFSLPSLASFESDRVQDETSILTVLNNFSLSRD